MLRSMYVCPRFAMATKDKAITVTSKDFFIILLGCSSERTAKTQLKQMALE